MATAPGWVSLERPRARLLASPPTQRSPLEVRRRLLDGRRAGRCRSRRATSWSSGATRGPVTATSVGPATSDRAVVFVHGRGGSRATGWWIAPTCPDRGWRVLLLAYRNDEGGPDGHGRYLLGGEWIDLAVALEGLAACGAREVVLVGWSMDGNIVASYLRARAHEPERFAHHPRPVGLVLYAPTLEWKRVIAHVARRHALPGGLASLVTAYGALAAGLDWRGLDHLTEVDHLRLPVLLYHGTDDDLVPVASSEQFARQLPHVELVVVPGAGHCRSANLDPGAYLTRLARFLERC
jgi:uncharacterized protein